MYSTAEAVLKAKLETSLLVCFRGVISSTTPKTNVASGHNLKYFIYFFNHVFNLYLLE